MRGHAFGARPDAPDGSDAEYAEYAEGENRGSGLDDALYSDNRLPLFEGARGSPSAPGPRRQQAPDQQRPPARDPERRPPEFANPSGGRLTRFSADPMGPDGGWLDNQGHDSLTARRLFDEPMDSAASVGEPEDPADRHPPAMEADTPDVPGGRSGPRDLGGIGQMRDSNPELELLRGLDPMAGGRF